MPPFFSLILATRNAGHVLPKCLESLAKQTYRDFEVVIQDGVSTDGTIQVAESFRDRLPTLSLAREPDTGIYDAWNRALDRAAGTWVLFLGADDRLAGPDVLARVAELLRASPEDRRYGVGGVDLIFLDGRTAETLPGRTVGARQTLREAMPFGHPSLFYRADLFAADRFDTSLRIAGDYDFVCRTWDHDGRGVELGFVVTRMSLGGLSNSPRHRLRTLYECARVASRYFGGIWTPRRVKVLAKAMLLYVVCKVLGTDRAAHALDWFRKVRGLPPCWTSCPTQTEQDLTPRKD